MPPYKKLPAFPAKKSCNFCSSRKADEYELGEIANIGNIYVHYYCLLLSSDVKQRGEDNQGILGFLPFDIKKELWRGKSLTCDYCKKKCATLKCSKQTCKAQFHLPCGLKKGSIHLFYNNFSSFCVNHRPKQTIPTSVLEAAHRQKSQCPICWEKVNAFVTNGAIWPICCKPKDILVHRKCLAKMAKTHGLYHFKCPLCNDTKTFIKEVKRLGFYIPEQDPEWEREPRAFQEMYVRDLKCAAELCLSSKGTDYNRQGTQWQIEPCQVCGHVGIHLACSDEWERGSEFNLQWTCSLCRSVVSKEIVHQPISSGRNPSNVHRRSNGSPHHQQHTRRSYPQQQNEREDSPAANVLIYDEEFEELDPLPEVVEAPENNPLSDAEVYAEFSLKEEEEEEEEEIDVCGDASPPALWPAMDTIDISDEELQSMPPLTPIVSATVSQQVSTIRYAVGLPIVIEDSDDEDVIKISDDER